MTWLAITSPPNIIFAWRWPKEKKKSDSFERYAEKAPSSCEKLEKNSRKISLLKVGEIQAILYMVYNVQLSGSKLRTADYVKALDKVLEKNTERYELFFHAVLVNP